MIKTSCNPRPVKTFLLVGVVVVCLAGVMRDAVADGFSAPIDDHELSMQRGREGSTFNLTSARSHLDGQLTDNVATGNTNGGNLIKGNALSGLKGHATVIQNSGNNNIIQDSTIYNFSLSP